MNHEFGSLVHYNPGWIIGHDFLFIQAQVLDASYLEVEETNNCLPSGHLVHSHVSRHCHC